jgi:hypothetical protein
VGEFVIAIHFCASRMFASLPTSKSEAVFHICSWSAINTYEITTHNTRSVAVILELIFHNIMSPFLILLFPPAVDFIFEALSTGQQPGGVRSPARISGNCHRRHILCFFIVICFIILICVRVIVIGGCHSVVVIVPHHCHHRTDGEFRDSAAVQRTRGRLPIGRRRNVLFRIHLAVAAGAIILV